MAYINGKKVLTVVKTVGVGDIDIEVNPSDTPTTTLETIKINATTYKVGEGVNVEGNPSDTPATTLEKIKIDTTTYSIPTPIEIEANPSEAATTDLTKLKVDGTTYSVGDGGTIVQANPNETPTDNLEKIKIDDKSYFLESEKYDGYYKNHLGTPLDTIKSDYSSIKNNDLRTDTQTDLKQTGDKLLHNATIVYNANLDKAYVVCTANQVDTADNMSSINTFVRLYIMSPDTTTQGKLNIDSYESVCEHNDTIDGLTVTSGVSEANIIMNNNEAIILFTCKLNDVTYECYAIYDCSTDTLSTPHRCTIDNDYVSVPYLSSLLGRSDTGGMLGFHGTIALYNGYWYACVSNGGLWNTGIVLKTNDGMNWEYVFTPVIKNSICQLNYEASIGFKNNYLYIAFRQTTTQRNGKGGMVLAKYSPLGVWQDDILIPSSDGKPTFIFNWNALFICVSQGARAYTEMLEINPTYLSGVTRKLVVMGGNYTTFDNKNDSHSYGYAVQSYPTTSVSTFAFNLWTYYNQALAKYKTAMG